MTLVVAMAMGSALMSACKVTAPRPRSTAVDARASGRAASATGARGLPPVAARPLKPITMEIRIFSFSNQRVKISADGQVYASYDALLEGDEFIFKGPLAPIEAAKLAELFAAWDRLENSYPETSHQNFDIVYGEKRIRAGIIETTPPELLRIVDFLVSFVPRPGAPGNFAKTAEKWKAAKRPAENP